MVFLFPKSTKEVLKTFKLQGEKLKLATDQPEHFRTVVWSQNGIMKEAQYKPLIYHPTTVGRESENILVFYSAPASNPTQEPPVLINIDGKNVNLFCGLISADVATTKIAHALSTQPLDQNTYQTMPFFVHHDPERKPYQHRFIESVQTKFLFSTLKFGLFGVTLFNLPSDTYILLAGGFGYFGSGTPGIGEIVHEVSKKLIGHELKSIQPADVVP